MPNGLLLCFQETASCGSCPEDDAVQNPKALVSWVIRQAGGVQPWALFQPFLRRRQSFFVIVIVLRNIVLLRLGQQFLLSGLGSVPQSLFAAVLRPLFKMLHSLLAIIGLHIGL